MKNTARPVAYIRRSVVSRSAPGDLSRQFQVDEVRSLAGDDGPSLVIIDGDWGRSGSRGKADQRDAFIAMLEATERGEVSALYAYATDRLARDVEAASRLLNACERASVPIIVKGQRFEPGDRAARQSFHLQAMMNEDYASQAGEKSRATLQRRDARGDRRGAPPYGWRLAARKPGEPVTWEPDPSESVDAILSAYHSAGSFHGAARLLNQRDVQAPRGSHWYGSRVRDILKAQRPDVAAVRQTTARVAHGSSSGAIFRRLLRCHCDGIPTPSRQRNGTYSYRCPKGHSDRAGHPVVQIPERVIVEWAKVEAARLRVPEAVVGTDDPVRRAELVAQREGVAEALILRLIDKRVAAAKRDAIDAELDLLDSAQVIAAVPPTIDWTWAPAALHDVLRATWEYVELGPDLHPTEALWRVPEWRAS